MKFRDLLDVIVSSLISTNRIRSFLTMLCVAVGVSLIIIITVVEKGTKESVLDFIKVYGADTIWISSSVDSHLLKAFTEIKRYPAFLKLADVQAINKLSPSVDVMAPVSQRYMETKYKNKYERFLVNGTTPSYLPARASKLINGRFITSLDDKSNSKVCVIELSEDSRSFFGGFIPINDRVLINNVNFRIVGVVETVQEQFGIGKILRIYIPLETMRNLFGVKEINLVIGRAKDLYSIKSAMNEINSILLQRYDYARQLFKVRGTESFTNDLFAVADLLEVALLGIAFIALIISGISITNIMFIAVTERRKEIGLLKAFGAKKKIIMLQFLIEPLVISVAGALFGIFLGLFFSKVIVLLMGVPFIVPVWITIIAIIFPALIGIISGFYPARQAANLDPIKALKIG